MDSPRVGATGAGTAVGIAQCQMLARVKVISEGVLHQSSARPTSQGQSELALATSTASRPTIHRAAGNWSTYTATYTATSGDAGKAIEILLNSGGVQGDFDNVVLSAVPEASTWCMLLIGFAGVGFVAYRRKNNSAFRFA